MYHMSLTLCGLHLSCFLSLTLFLSLYFYIFFWVCVGVRVWVPSLLIHPPSLPASLRSLYMWYIYHMTFSLYALHLFFGIWVIIFVRFVIGVGFGLGLGSFSPYPPSFSTCFSLKFVHVIHLPHDIFSICDPSFFGIWVIIFVIRYMPLYYWRGRVFSFLDILVCDTFTQCQFRSSLCIN